MNKTIHPKGAEQLVRGLDGHEVLKQLQAEYEKKRRKRRKA